MVQFCIIIYKGRDIMSYYIKPEKLLKSFTCPICGTLASMEWDEILIMYDGNNRFYFDKARNTCGSGIVRVSTCNACNGYHIWYRDDMIYPVCSEIELPNDNMPEDVREIYLEARNIFKKSPRSSCALLRLGIQMLCDNLVEGNENLNGKIGHLVRDGLNEKIQRALDIIRVIGNNAVHPGQISVDDNIDVAKALFKLTNIIVDQMITQVGEIDDLYGLLPSGIIESIERRDR